MSKAMFTVGVFGLACRLDEVGTLRIKVNVRGDQERQLKLAGVPSSSSVLIIDAPGGGVQSEDFPEPKQASLLDVLRREIAEETGGCAIEPLADFSGPFMVVTNNHDETKPTGDLAFWMPVFLSGTPQPTDEAINHPWITREQLEAENEYRCVGGLGKAGRTGRMISAAFEWFEKHKYDRNIFSVPE